jgi:hypothetical protein
MRRKDYERGGGAQERKFNHVVKSAQQAAALVLVY